MLEPDEMYEAHVNLIQHGRKVCHAQRPDHDACPLRAALPVRRSEGALTEDFVRGRSPMVIRSVPPRTGCTTPGRT